MSKFSTISVSSSSIKEILRLIEEKSTICWADKDRPTVLIRLPRRIERLVIEDCGFGPVLTYSRETIENCQAEGVDLGTITYNINDFLSAADMLNKKQILDLNDKVKISDPGKVYATYLKWVDKNLLNKHLWKKEYIPSEEDTGVVIAKAEHSPSNKTMLYAVALDGLSTPNIVIGERNSIELLDQTSSSPKQEGQNYPDSCPHCGSPAYIGLGVGKIDCSNSSCNQ